MTLKRAFTFLLGIGLFVSACKKPTLEDTRVLPDDNLGLNYTDTLTVETSLVPEDSVDVGAATLCLLGSMQDPEFGYTNAGFYIPFELGRNNLTLDDTTVTLDSIVLMMAYFSTYGDLRTPQTVQVFEMTERIIESDTVDYYSNKTFDINTTVIGSKTFVPNMRDSIHVGSAGYAPSLRIKLSNSFGQKFIDASGTADYANDESFREFFNGLHVAASKAGGGEGLVAFNPFSNGVFITIYYHDIEDSAASHTFLSEPTLVVNHYEHDYRNSNIDQAGDSLLFIQGLAGLNAKFKVPHIKNMGNIVINKAELVVTVLPSSLGNDTTFTPPARLTMLVCDSAGNMSGVTPDQGSVTIGIFGGTRIEETDSSGQKLIKYKFSLSRYYQEVISHGREDYGIFILPDRRYQIPDRLVAGGGNHSQYALKLNLVYELID